jgi:aminoglycoside 6-adenylyltransferase
MTVDREDPIIQKLIRLGEAHDEVRAVILTSSRANGSCDLLSDYDVEFYVTDPSCFIDHHDWYETFGPILVMLALPRDDGPGCTRLVQYQDGSRIDFQVIGVEELHQICAAPKLTKGLDIGYVVLLDKDGIAASLRPPTLRAFVPEPPSAAHFADAANDFWWMSTYVAKSLWRGEALASASWLDHLRRVNLVPMLNWSVEMERDWSWPTGLYGKGLGKTLGPETRQEIIAACKGGGINELWAALFATTSLFRTTALQVGETLGYQYPHDLDARVTAYLRTISMLDPGLSCREELSKQLREGFAKPLT